MWFERNVLYSERFLSNHMIILYLVFLFVFLKSMHISNSTPVSKSTASSSQSHPAYEKN